ncbi:MAG: 3-keto-5-aminohexanoate cleavage protein [Marinibacterium sp.]|nr:3-keto-5-aminohexanoate cleavage protein [Marinibacterium sp.]
MIMVAPNGARAGKADHPALPITLDETVATAAACRAAGAEALHLHVRDADGQHSLDAGRYRATLDALSDTLPGLPVQITTESAGRFDPAEQYACLTRVQPLWASVSIREMARDPTIAAKAYAACAEMGTQVQHILYSTDDAVLLSDWQRAGLIPATPQSVILVLGRYDDGLPSDPAALPAFLTALPRVANWMLCAFGPTEHACLRAAHAKGGGMRVGFENSRTDATGAAWPDNAASVRALIASLPQGDQA